MIATCKKLLKRSTSTKICVAVILLCIVSLCAIGLNVASKTDAESNQVEKPDAAGLSPSNNPDTNNSINITQQPDTSFIYDVAIEELTNADSYLAGQTVQVTGEVVGDRIQSLDENYCWITLQSQKSDSQIAIYMTKLSSEKIDTYGAYGKRGTTLKVRGIFHLSCKDHHGISDVLAEDVNVVSKGEVLKTPLDPRQLVLGLVLIIAGCILTLTFNIVRERNR